MNDRDEVIKGLTEVSEYMRAKADIAGVGKGKEVFDSWYRAAEDALALLKEREPKTVLHRNDGDYCPQCSTIASRTMGVQKLHLGTHYCPYCGQAVKWE